MLKRICIEILILIICFNSFCFATIDETTDDLNEEDLLYKNSEISMEEPKTYSKHIICIERTTCTILFEKDAYTQTAMASTTKILTGIIALENCDLNEEIEISSKAANTGGSTLGITANSKIRVESLLYGLLLRSRQ